MTGAPTTHPPPQGKSILVICCSHLCLDMMVRKAIMKPWPAPVSMPTPYRLECQGDGINFVMDNMLDRIAVDARYDEIYTCGNVHLSQRLLLMLKYRLADPFAWTGYFSEFP